MIIWVTSLCKSHVVPSSCSSDSTYTWKNHQVLWYSISSLVSNFKFSVWSHLKLHLLLLQLCGWELLKMWPCTLDFYLLENSGKRKKTEKKRKTHREHVEVKPLIQHIFDGSLPAKALLDLKGLSSAKAGIKKHSCTSNSNQSLLFLTAVKAFMLTRHRGQSFIHAFKSDWPVNEHVCVPASDNTPYLCQHTLSLLLILPLILCLTPTIMHNLFVIPLTLCMSACTQGCVFFSRPS